MMKKVILNKSIGTFAGLAGWCLVAVLSCKKGSYNSSPDARVFTTADTLFFDTVFTSSGSVTKSFKILNNNDQKIRISKVALAGGASSAFKLNIDGVASNELQNITLEANDSMYVFVQVNVNPNQQTNPFILMDSIEMSVNGNTGFVQLRAYGQNAVFLKNAVIKGRQTWTNRLPYVITGGVRVDTNAILTVEAGARIYLHADAPLLVDGTLRAVGERQSRITFSGDRLDEAYKDLPASWPGIFFRSTSKNNFLEYTIVRNAFRGIIVHDRSVATAPKLTLSKCIIDNMYDAGIFAVNSEIYADNCLITNCGSNIMLNYGGDYQFTFCTVATYGNSYIAHKNPVLTVTDFIEENGVTYSSPLKALFINSIFWGENGTVDNEIAVLNKGAGNFNVQFDHVLYKAKDEINDAVFISSIKNAQPLFDSINPAKRVYDFRINNSPASPAAGAGKPTSFLLDLDGKPRKNPPDVGSYERD